VALMMKRALMSRMLACGVCLMAFAPVPASADIFNFAFKDINQPAVTFQIDTAAPQQFSNQFFFGYSMPGGYAGFSNTSFGPYDFVYQDSTGSYSYQGPQLYSGNENSPTFLTGAFNLVGDQFPPSSSGPTGTLNISRAAGPGAPAPEIGMGLLSALAAGLALFLSRMRMPAFTFASRRRFAAA
jgi:hypothetical protein